MPGGEEPVIFFAYLSVIWIADLQNDDMGRVLIDLQLDLRGLVFELTAAVKCIFQKISEQHAKINIIDRGGVWSLRCESAFPDTAGSESQDKRFG